MKRFLLLALALLLFVSCATKEASTEGLSLTAPPSHQMLLTFTGGGYPGYTVFECSNLVYQLWHSVTNVIKNSVMVTVPGGESVCFFRALASPMTSVNLSWLASPDPLVVGYKIYYGDQSADYTTNLDVGDTTNAIVPGLTPGDVYYFAATAYTSNRMESAFSNQVFYEAPTNQMPVGVAIRLVGSTNAPVPMIRSRPATKVAPLPSPP